MRSRLILALFLFLTACGKLETPTDPGVGGEPIDPTATFTRVQNEIFTPSCATISCHHPIGQQSQMILTAGQAYAMPTDPVEINQENCHYTPHVFTMRTNQPLKVKNSDMTLHNIHAWAEKNPQFNVGQPVKGMVNETKFAQPEIPLPIKCDVHKWMGAFVGVFDNPFNTVSKSGGAFELKLPPGNYEITAWHEKLGQKTMMVEVKDNDKKEVNFSFSATDKAAD